MVSRVRPSSQSGFTLIEVLVAMLILLVGVLGVVTMVDGANAVTSKTKAREGGTAIARSIIEISRSLRYRDLTQASLEAALDTRPAMADSKPSVTGYTIKSRGITYELTLTVCSLDDPKDDLGLRPPGTTFCPDSDGPPATARDRNPDDYKRVRVRLTWSTRATTHSVTQTSSIINPVGGLGPSVTGLTMTSPTSAGTDEVRIEGSSLSPINSASFVATTSTFAADLTWSVGGDSQGKANGGPTSWTFTWNFTDGGSDPDNILYYDCKYFIQADGFDAEGRAGAPRVLTVILNRREPIAPAQVTGGRNGSGDRVDIHWNGNPECDVIGYRVYRSTSAASLGTQVNCPVDPQAPNTTVTTRDWCVDQEAPATGPLYYRVVAVDTLASGTLREGTQSAQVTVPASGGNSVPSAPTNITSCIGGQVDCNGPDGLPAPSGQIVVRWDPSTDSDGAVSFYRIYRDGTTYGDRWDDFFPEAGGLLAWLEYAPGTTSHTYRVTAVDDKFGESALSDPVTAG
jgi:prepilin-type N-terminal cleavage/methylation domain-containing protein